MKKTNVLVFIFLFCVAAYCYGEVVRSAVFAGRFYPSSSSELKNVVDDYIKSADSDVSSDENVDVIIVPHAGYVYSGRVAGYGFKSVAGGKYDVVAVLAVSHHVPFQGVSLFEGDYYETPLGKVPIDKESCEYIKKYSGVAAFVPKAHKAEHSLEVELPFLQESLDGEFKLIPILFGDRDYNTAKRIAKVLYDISREKKLLVVASSDLSHYLPYEIAVKKDEATTDAILRLDSYGLQNYFDTHNNCACGAEPIVSAVCYSELVGDKTRILLYAENSGDTAGSRRSVVGYASIAFLRNTVSEGAGNRHVEECFNKNGEGNNMSGEFSKETAEEMFYLARHAISSYLNGKFEIVESHNLQLQGRNGVFVTLHTHDGKLRGCIGCFVSTKPLYETIQEMAVSAAFKDPRFLPVSSVKELNELHMEISVLSPMKKIDDVNEIKLGRDGIYIKKGFRSGTFLPQVATETGWNLEEFLGHCARDKAGIGWDGWKDAEIYTYTADIYEEEKK